MGRRGGCTQAALGDSHAVREGAEAAATTAAATAAATPRAPAAQATVAASSSPSKEV